MTWFKVQPTDYYSAFEEPVSKGKRLVVENGIQISVKWPDETVTRETLIVQDGRGSAQVDMNNSPDRFKTRRLFVERNEHGTKTRVPLTGLHVGLWEREK